MAERERLWQEVSGRGRKEGVVVKRKGMLQEVRGCSRKEGVVLQGSLQFQARLFYQNSPPKGCGRKGGAVAGSEGAV